MTTVEIFLRTPSLDQLIKLKKDDTGNKQAARARGKQVIEHMIDNDVFDGEALEQLLTEAADMPQA